MGMEIAKQGRATAEQFSAPKDIRTGLRADEIAAALIDNLHCLQGKLPQHATRNDWYMALAYTVRDRMMDRYVATVESIAGTGTATKIVVLYPNAEPEAGKLLRLAQQYFFVSCSLQDMIRLLLLRGKPIDELHTCSAAQLNDIHPALAIAELMRLLIDEHALEWDQAWAITQQTCGYTNHALLTEALERWPLSLLAKLLPRHIEIIRFGGCGSTVVVRLLT